MNILFIIILLIEIALGLLFLQRERKQPSSFFSVLFLLCVVGVVFLAFFTNGAPTLNQSQNEIPQAAQMVSGFTSTFLSLILLFLIVIIQYNEAKLFLSLYHALIGGLLGFVILHIFFKVIAIPPYLLFYEKLSTFNIQILTLYLLIIETAFLVGLAAVVGQQRIVQNSSFLATISQYAIAFSIFLTMALFYRQPDASPTLWPYENIFALIISLFCGLSFWALFQKKWRLLAASVLVVPLYFVVIR